MEYQMIQLINTRLANASAAFFALLGRVWGWLSPSLMWVLRGILGSWRPPVWIRKVVAVTALVGAQLQRRLASVALVGLLAFGVMGFWPQLQKWTHGLMPDKPVVVMASGSAADPKRTEIELDGTPNPAVINFTKPVVPIALVGKEAQDITLEPPTPGRWMWVNQSRMEFRPAADWPVGQAYKVKLGSKALVANVEIEKRNYDFNAPVFSAQFDNAEFYQDPVQANLRRAVFSVRFSHPVNIANRGVVVIDGRAAADGDLGEQFDIGVHLAFGL